MSVPAIPADLNNGSCLNKLTAGDADGADSVEIKKNWRTDRLSYVKLEGCYWRVVCLLRDVRRSVGHKEQACKGKATS